jgi:hypothetical protein
MGYNVTPCNPLKVSRRLGTARRLHLQGSKISQANMLVSFLAYSSTLEMEVTCSYETSVDFQLTTRPYIPEDGTLKNMHIS